MKFISLDVFSGYSNCSFFTKIHMTRNFATPPQLNMIEKLIFIIDGYSS